MFERIAMIPCAGFGRRMGELTGETPKPLLKVNGVPLLYYSLFLLYLWEVEHCIINLHYLGEQIIEALKDFPHFPIHFSYERERILGTAGGIRQAMETTPLQGRFLYMNPDTIFWPEDSPFDQLGQIEQSSHNLYLYLSKKEAGNAERGFRVVATGDLDRRFLPIRMDTGDYFYSGISLLHTDAVQSLNAGEVAELRDTFALCGMHGTEDVAPRLFGRHYRGERLDCGTALDFEILKRVDPVPLLWKDRWRTFLASWISA